MSAIVKWHRSISLSQWGKSGALKSVLFKSDAKGEKKIHSFYITADSCHRQTVEWLISRIYLVTNRPRRLPFFYREPSNAIQSYNSYCRGFISIGLIVTVERTPLAYLHTYVEKKKVQPKNQLLCRAVLPAAKCIREYNYGRGVKRVWEPLRRAL